MPTIKREDKEIPKTKRGDKKIASVSLYFDAEILNDQDLSTAERLLIALMVFRDKKPKGCYSSNANLANFLNCSKTTISKTISSLYKKGYITASYPDEENGGRRYIRKVKLSIKKCKGD